MLWILTTSRLLSIVYDGFYSDFLNSLSLFEKLSTFLKPLVSSQSIAFSRPLSLLHSSIARISSVSSILVTRLLALWDGQVWSRLEFCLWSWRKFMYRIFLHFHIFAKVILAKKRFKSIKSVYFCPFVLSYWNKGLNAEVFSVITSDAARGFFKKLYHASNCCVKPKSLSVILFVWFN